MADQAGRARSQWASVRALGAVVDKVAPRVSVARVRQLRMVVGMWGRALAVWPEGRVPRPSRSVRAMFAPAALRVFWGLVVEGEVGARPGRGGGVPVATLRVVRDCLGILGEEVVPGGVRWLPEVPQQSLRAPVPAGQLGVVYRRLVDMASDAPVERGTIRLEPEHRVRLLAMTAVVLDTWCRSAEVAAMRLADLDVEAGTLVVRRRPQNGAHLEAVVEVMPLREGTVVALRRWLRVRRGLVSALQGADPGALWVSVKPAQGQPVVGMPLRPRGVQRSYAAGAVALNGLMAGQAGWEPLPRSLERLRRGAASPPQGSGG